MRSIRFKQLIPALLIAAGLVAEASDRASAEEPEFLTEAEVGQVVKNLELFLNSIRAVRTSRDRYHFAPESDAYLANWEHVYVTNIERFKKRKKVSKKKATEYFQAQSPDLLKWIDYSQLMVPLKDVAESPLYTVDDCGICQKFVRQGKDVFGYFAEIAATSRPEPIKFGDVMLKITLNEPAKNKDYWPERTPELDLTLSNEGPDDAEDVTLALTFSNRINGGLQSDAMTCENDRKGKTGTCRTDVLANGATTASILQFDLARRYLRLRREDEFRTTVTVDALASSEDPEAATSKQISFTVRDCKRAYSYELRKARQLKLPKYQRSVRDALNAIDSLPGRTLFPQTNQVVAEYLRERGETVNTDLQDLARQVTLGKGTDTFLSHLRNGSARFARVRSDTERLADQLMADTRSSMTCSSPVTLLSFLRRGLEPIRDRARQVAHMATAARAQVDARRRILDQLMADTGPKDPEQTPLGAIGEGLQGKARMFVSNQTVSVLMDMLNFAETNALRYGTKAVGIIGGLKSVVEIIGATNDLMRLSNESGIRALHGWIEVSTYTPQTELT